MVDNRKPTIENLYPDLSDEDLKEAEKNLKKYVDLLYRIALRRALRHWSEDEIDLKDSE